MSDELHRARRHREGRDCGESPCSICGASAMAWLEREATKASPETVASVDALLADIFAKVGDRIEKGPCTRSPGCILAAGHWTCCIVAGAGAGQ